MHECLTNAHSCLYASFRGIDQFDDKAAQACSKTICLYGMSERRSKTTLPTALDDTRIYGCRQIFGRAAIEISSTAPTSLNRSCADTISLRHTLPCLSLGC